MFVLESFNCINIDVVDFKELFDFLLVSGSSKSGPPPSAGINSLPDLPDIPSASLPSSGGPPGQNSEDIDMDDIDRRFQELKRKK